ncbi:hypothetical protein ACHWQZ_G009275 [Mnemiopsis leidyi]
MLIFWKLVTKEDEELFNKGSSESSLTVNTTTTVYQTTQMDQIINFTLGSVLILCFLLSTSLNPVLFYHHQSTRKNSICTFLFSCLSVSDFLTDLFAPLVYAHYMIRPGIYSGSLFSLEFSRVFACTVGCYSQCGTTLLAITRLLKVTMPFIKIKKRFVVAYFIVYNTIMSGNNLPILLLKQIDRSQRTLYFTFCNICIWLNAIHCLVGIVLSVATFVFIYFIKPVSETEDRDKNKRVCGTILLMNTPYIISIFFVIFVYISPWQVSIHDIIFGFVPMFTSAINPLVLISRNQGIRNTLKGVVTRRVYRGSGDILSNNYNSANRHSSANNLGKNLVHMPYRNSKSEI